MVKQGDIIKIDFDPQSGHEQAGYRPALVISNHVFNSNTNMTIVCPITNAGCFPLHLPLDEKMITTGFILCQHVKALDIEKRGYKFVEKLPSELLKQVVDMVYKEIEII